MQNVFLNDGNRPYCEDWSYIDTIARNDEPHATENPPTSPSGIDFFGRHKILFAHNFEISEIRLRQKPGTHFQRQRVKQSQKFGFCTTIGKIIALSQHACINSLAFPVRDIGAG